MAPNPASSGSSGSAAPTTIPVTCPSCKSPMLLVFPASQHSLVLTQPPSITPGLICPAPLCGQPFLYARGHSTIKLDGRPALPFEAIPPLPLKTKEPTLTTEVLPTSTSPIPDLTALSYEDLRTLARKLGVRGHNHLHRPDLEDAILKHYPERQAAASDETEPEPKPRVPAADFDL